MGELYLLRLRSYADSNFSTDPLVKRFLVANMTKATGVRARTSGSDEDEGESGQIMCGHIYWNQLSETRLREQNERLN